MVKLIAFDLDGTLTQHKTPLEPANLKALQELATKYKLVMAGAGACMRIFNQLNQYPIDVIGNYGLQSARYNKETKTLDIVCNEKLPCDRASVEERVRCSF
jgi:trehalose-6-phosphatase